MANTRVDNRRVNEPSSFLCCVDPLGHAPSETEGSEYRSAYGCHYELYMGNFPACSRSNSLLINAGMDTRWAKEIPFQVHSSETLWRERIAASVAGSYEEVMNRAVCTRFASPLQQAPCFLHTREETFFRSMLPPSIPEPVQPLLNAYLRHMEARLPGLLAGFYLHGSLALGAFNLHSSDIDFITVVTRRCTPEDVERLRQIHQEVATQYPRWGMSGSYLLWEDLGQFEETIPPGPCYHDGILKEKGHNDISSVTWWVLKNRGIALVGPAPHSLPFTVDWEKLLTDMHHNLNTYWKNFTRKPKRMAWLVTDFGIEWTVLGVLRQYYTFRENDITSKAGAGEYALLHLPPRWHRLIREALRIRQQSGTSAYRSRLFRAFQAWRFLHYVICMGNALRGLR
jgi:hypothetical protein